MVMASEPSSDLSTAERGWLEAVQSAESLAELVQITDADSEHDAYITTKQAWFDLREKELLPLHRSGGLPGDPVRIDGHMFWVHGVTHADTEAEREFLREHVRQFLDAGASVYCEQGIRSMYFSDLSHVGGMDDYLWAMERCKELGLDTHLDEVTWPAFDGLVEEINSLAAQFQDIAFSLIDSGSDLYGEEVSWMFGDVASHFLMDHGDMATATNFTSFSLSRQAAQNPDTLPELHTYYRKAFLPQPIEREWLRRHDRELEVFTHARNERMADYAVYHNEDVSTVHLIVGAAHQPGIRYYLDRYRIGRRSVGEFEQTG